MDELTIIELFCCVDDFCHRFQQKGVCEGILFIDSTVDLFQKLLSQF